jgi:hypothetical protein
MLQRTPASGAQGAVRRAGEQGNRLPAGTARIRAATSVGGPSARTTASGMSGRAREFVLGAARLSVPGESRVRVTARGALAGMFAVCFASSLLAYLLHLEVLVGLGFCAACVLAPAYAVRPALLEVVTAPPVTFLLAVVVVQGLTAQGDSSHASMLSVLEGTLLTLAAIAPWLFVGTVLCVVIAMRRGLPDCVRDLRASLRGDAAVRTRRG